MGDHPVVPMGWHYFGRADEVRERPLSRTVGGRPIVVFRSGDGTLSALFARCCHVGADLGLGEVVNGRLKCGLHGWEFASDGRCVHIPCGEQPPHFARQSTFPVAEVAGHIFVFNRSKAAYPMPFFDGATPDQLIAAPEYRMIVASPWTIVGANGFDTQHFAHAHDRTLVGDVRVTDLGRYARRIAADFEVSGESWRDSVTRLASGSRLTMTITVWGGLLIFVEAKFRKSTTYGMLCLLPEGPERTIGVNLIFVRRREGLGRVLDPLDARIRRHFVRQFLGADLRVLQGLRFSPASLIEADRTMREYLNWLPGATIPTATDSNGNCEEVSCDQCSSRHCS